MTAATAFEILPAIDLRGGRVVRLRQGDFDRETVYSDDPAARRDAVRRCGARWLHVVDLDGARAGAPSNSAVIDMITRSVGDMDARGGRWRACVRRRSSTRSWPSAQRGRSSGPRHSRTPRSWATLIERHGTERIAVAIDVRDGLAVGQGWVPGAWWHRCGRGHHAARRRRRDDLRSHRDRPRRPPWWSGPRALRAIVAVWLPAGSSPRPASPVSMTCLALRDLGCAGAIVGRAFLDGSMDLGDVMAELAR